MRKGLGCKGFLVYLNTPSIQLPSCNRTMLFVFRAWNDSSMGLLSLPLTTEEPPNADRNLEIPAFYVQSHFSGKGNVLGLETFCFHSI